MTEFFCGLCSLVLVLDIFLIVSTASGEYEQMALECSRPLLWMFSGISKFVLLRPKKHKENWVKAKIKVCSIIQFLEVPWNGPWALWEGYCGSAMQHTTLNSTKLPGSTTELWELQTAFTASLMYLFCSLHTSRYQLHVVASHKEAKYKYTAPTMMHISI
jgi:hypothetical protein